MGKQYTTAPILVNSNGDPIPQYLDITDKTDSPQGTFKPLTNETIQKVQLTGSNVVLISQALNVTVAPNNTIYPLQKVDISQFKELFIQIRPNTLNKYDLQYIVNRPDGIGLTIKIISTYENDSTNKVTESFKVNALTADFGIKNNTNTEHTILAIYLFGRRY